ncbi:MAG: cell division protein ZapA [Bacteroidia bacterium]|jgi:cell division protein ZapA|nr:cell division protein ZapA [Bacteroidia bacterium]
MGELSLKITIAGRTYPLTVDSREENAVAEAVKLINARVQELEATYLVKDKQDLLAMAALQFATQYLDARSKTIDDPEGLIRQLESVETMLDNHLRLAAGA